MTSELKELDTQLSKFIRQFYFFITNSLVTVVSITQVAMSDERPQGNQSNLGKIARISITTRAIKLMLLPKDTADPRSCSERCWLADEAMLLLPDSNLLGRLLCSNRLYFSTIDN